MTGSAEVVGLRYARRNVLFGPSGSAAALYRLDMSTYPLLGVGEKQALAARLERLACSVGADFSLWRVHRAYPAERYLRELERAVDRRGQSPEAWRTFLAAHEQRLLELDCHVPAVYLSVALSTERTQRPGAGFIARLDEARDRVTALGFARRGGTATVTGRSLHALALAEQRLAQRLSQVVGLRRARTSELQWLLRRAPMRGIGEPVNEQYWQPDALVIRPDSNDGATDRDAAEVSYEPLQSDVWRLVREPMREEPDHPPGLYVRHESGDSFQAFLTLAGLPEEALFPGPASELLHAPIDALGFAVDAVLHAQWIGNREALAQVRKRIVDVEQVHRDQQASRHGAGWKAEDDRLLAREYESILQSASHPPMLKASISLAIGAGSREERERRVEALREQYGDLRLERPRGLQEQLYFDHLPRADGGRTRDYVQQMTVAQFGAMVPTASTQVGDPSGVYLGYTTVGGRRPVRYDVTAPSRESRASAVLLAGTLGSGKTVAAQLIAYGAERRGGLIIDVDPKPDHGWENIPSLQGRVDVLELTGSEQQRGKLDPLAIGLEELREELAASYLLDLLRDPPASWEIVVQRAVRDVVRAGGRGCLLVIDRLREMDSSSAVEVADALEVVSDFGLARLGFGNGTTDLAVAAKAVTTIRTPGLTLPEPGVLRESYTRSERISVATLSLVAALALRLACTDRSRHKVVLLDEVWFLLASAQGRALVNRLVLQLRAFNATVLLLIQRLSDVKDLSELVGTFFVFGQDGNQAAQAGLELVGVQPTRERIARLRDARPGRCVMRDLQGRTAWVQIDPTDPTLLDAFDTTPPEQATDSPHEQPDASEVVS